MKYYIATSTERVPAHNIVRDQLKQFGCEITYDWTTHGSVRHTTKERLAEVALSELAGIADSDFVLVLLPGGKGTHVELGFSIGSKKKVFIHSEDPNVFEMGPKVCAFYFSPDVVRFSCPISKIADHLLLLLQAEDHLLVKNIVR